MRLLIKLMELEQPADLLATIDKVDERAEFLRPGLVQRHISGQIRMRGPLWADAARIWGISGVWRPINLLHIDHDLYYEGVTIRVVANMLEIVAVEPFDGTVAEYAQHVVDRNHKVADFCARWDRGEITGNEMRAIDNLSPMPELNRPLGVEVLKSVRDYYWPKAMLKGFALNMIVGD